MNAHNDGEKDLGPVVESFLLGDQGRITFMTKQRLRRGKDHKGKQIKDDPVVNGYSMEK